MVLFLALFILWVVLNGRITLEICLFGVVISAALCLFSRKYLGYGQTHHAHPFRFAGLLIEYLLILIVEIIKANVAVVRIGFARKLNFDPVLVYFTTDLKKDTSRVILANSITLTPGTITVILHDGQYCVHCLDRSLAKGIDSSVFVRLLEKMEET